VKKTFSKAYEKASRELAKELDQLVKSKTAEDGWDSKVSQGMTVRYKSGGFSMSSKYRHKNMVFDLEYGDGTKLGTGTLHKLKNNPKDLADRFAVLYEKWVMKL
jgi:hypothetical protein